MKYIETVRTLSQLLAKGYLCYEPHDFDSNTSWQQNEYRVVNLQGTYLIYK